MNFIDVLLEEHKIDYFLVTEHWLLGDNLKSIKISGYQAISEFTRKNTTHGGVAIFVNCKHSNVCKEIKEIKLLSIEVDIECCAILVNKHLCMIDIYRSPTGNIETFFIQLCKILDIATNSYKKIIICGDLNIDILKNNVEKKILCDILESYGVESLIRQPTRIATRGENTSATAIDHLITNVKNEVSYSIIDAGISDHTAQIIKLHDLKTYSNVTDTRNNIFTRKFSASNINEFKFLLKKFTPPSIQSSDIDNYFELFWDHFSWAFEVSFPKSKQKDKTKNCNGYGNWYTHQLKRESDNLKNLNRLRKTNPNQKELNENYKKLKAQYNKNIISAKQNFYLNIINHSDNKIRTLWNIVNNKLNKNRNRPEFKINHNNELISDVTNISNIFGEYFVSVTNDQLKKHFGDNISNSCTTSVNYVNDPLLLEHFTAEEISEIISNLKNKKSTGYDEVPVILLKKCSSELSEIIATILNKSIELGEFPKRLKISVIIPVYKKDDPLQIQNYRPIALLSIISKIMEKAVSVRMIKFLETHKIFACNQHGFREGRSTETATLNFIQYINEKMEKKEYIIGLFFDLSRAFDSLNFNFVAKKLSKLGIQGSLQQWIYSFLNNRKIVVRIDDKTSSQFEINSGIPQGSVLGPLIFLMFINDLPDYILDGEVFIFADDTNIIISDLSIPKVIEKVNNVLMQFDHWCQKNRFIINYSKTMAIEFHKCSRPKIADLKLCINNHPITVGNQCKFLGTMIDECLSYNDCINCICSKINKQYFAILTLKNCLNEQGLLTAYYSLIYSTISYNIIVYGLAVESSRVFIAQKRIIRLMYNLSYRQSCRQTFKEKKILTFTSIFLFKILVYIFTNKDQYRKNSDIHDHLTRKNNQIRLERFNYSSFKKSPQYAGCYFFNMLPQEISSATTLTSFKSKLKNHLLENVFYSVEEFVTFSERNN